ncbi:glycosyltransferase family 4 protein [Solirubrobacter sp. CPCC 204708]|nr:glycosyltransferase family 4 protein [Solirubrobacter deserti]
MTAPRLAYVVAEYPKVSHTFVAREVAALRAAGATIDTVTIRRTPETGLLSEEDRRAAAETFAVLPAAPAALLRAHARWGRRGPRRYVRTLAQAVRLGAPGLRNRLWQLFYFAEAGLLADELHRRGTEHVHAHFATVGSAVALLAARLLGKPWSFTMHGPLEFDAVERYAIADKVRDAAFVACISDFCRAQLMRLVEPAHWDKLHIVHCGLEPERYAAPAREVRDVVELLAIGRLEPMKGFAVLIDAVAALVREGEPVRLTIVGDGPQRAALEARARGLPVTFTGALGAPAVTERLRAADVFCLASFAEGVPVVLMEAMASGLPVVTTQIMGVPELVDDGESGLLVAPGRPEPFADALRRVVREPDLRARLGRAGQAKVAAEFDVRTAAGVLQRLFAEAAQR